jgi:16S rRNA G966 N2-methylase RsmD
MMQAAKVDPGFTMPSIDNLKTDHKNARKRTDRSAKLISESLQRYGAARSIVIDENNRILAGNGTIEGAKAAGIKNVRVIETDGSEIIAVKRTGLSEDEKVGLALADNRTSDLSDWDKDMLQQLSEEHDIAPWFDADDLAEILGTVEELPAEGLTDADDVPEAPEEPVSKTGDIWILGKHRVMCGDSTVITDVERLMAGGKADMVFTDPPYGVAYEGGHNDKKRQQIQNDALEGEDLTSLFYGALITAVTVTEDYAPFYVWFASGKSVETFAAFAQLPLKLRAVIQWYKVRSGLGAFMSQYIPNCEPCMYAYKSGCSPQWFGPSDEKTVWELQKESRNEFHPTQKPVELPERAITNSSKKGQLVLDLFGGSGSTLIACEKTGRQSRVMELDPRYCDVIVKRWEDFTGKKAILEEAPEAF